MQLGGADIGHARRVEHDSMVPYALLFLRQASGQLQLMPARRGAGCLEKDSAGANPTMWNNLS